VDRPIAARWERSVVEDGIPAIDLAVIMFVYRLVYQCLSHALQVAIVCGVTPSSRRVFISAFPIA
jgi:hypothetical protein